MHSSAPDNKIRLPLFLRGGFSLVEIVIVIVSTAILAVILVLFASMFSSTQEGVRRLNNSTKQRQETRVVLAKIAGELKESLTSPSVSYESNDPAARQFQLLNRLLQLTRPSNTKLLLL